VDAVIAVLGLSKSRDTIIGGYLRRGVSGAWCRTLNSDMPDVGSDVRF
jgi:hypothetical protein